MFSSSRQFAPRALQYRVVCYPRKELAHFVRKHLSTNDGGAMTKEHRRDLQLKELTQWTDAFNSKEAINKTVSLLKNYQMEICNQLEQNYDEHIQDLEKEISQLVKGLKVREAYIQILEKKKKEYGEMLEKNKELAENLSNLVDKQAKKAEHVQYTARLFRCGRIRNVRSALEYIRRRVRPNLYIFTKCFCFYSQ